MASFRGPATLPLTGCICLLVAAIFVVLAYASPYWSTQNGEHTGLWRTGVCGTITGCWFTDHISANTPYWVNSVRGLLSVSIILLGLVLVCVPVYVYVSIGLYYRVAMIIAAAASGIAALFVFIAVIIYGAESAGHNWSLAWCFAICIVGGIFTVFATIIFIVCILVKKPKFKEYHERKVIRYQEQPRVYIVQDNPAFYTMT